MLLIQEICPPTASPGYAFKAVNGSKKHKHSTCSLDYGAADVLPQAVRAAPEASTASTTTGGAEAPKHKHPHLHKIGQKAHIVRKDDQDPDESKFHEKELKGKKGVVVSADPLTSPAGRGGWAVVTPLKGRSAGFGRL